MGARIAALLIALIATTGGGYWWGARATDNAWQAKAAKAERTAAAQTRAAEDKGDKAVAAYVREHFDQEARYADIAETNRKLAAQAGLFIDRQTPGCSLDAVHSVVAVSPAAGPAAAQTPVSVAAPDVPADPELSLRAVWLWNSALAGIDTPTGACSPAGGAAAAGAACAQGSGISAEDAWANHTLNAKSCLADRTRYRALIQLLRERGVEPERAPH